MEHALPGLHVGRLAAIAFAGALLASPALAVGSGSDEPPAPSPTTSECVKGKIWSARLGKCVPIQKSGLTDDQLFENARELAYAGRAEDALAVLDAMAEGETSRVLTYRGYLARAAGQPEAALRHYGRALRIDPDNILARSYMGQGFAVAGDLVSARAQLSEIRARGGRGSWPETALRLAIETGRGTSY